jgi:hypothetical protein
MRVQSEPDAWRNLCSILHHVRLGDSGKGVVNKLPLGQADINVTQHTQHSPININA